MVGDHERSAAMQAAAGAAGPALNNSAAVGGAAPAAAAAGAGAAAVPLSSFGGGASGGGGGDSTSCCSSRRCSSSSACSSMVSAAGAGAGAGATTTTAAAGPGPGPAAAPAGGASDCGPDSPQHGLRPPPARYSASLPNLACLARVSRSALPPAGWGSWGGSGDAGSGRFGGGGRHHRAGRHHHHHLLHHHHCVGGGKAGGLAGGAGCAVDPASCAPPRTSVLCRLLVAMTVLLVCLQALSCGLFFCVKLPFAHHHAHISVAGGGGAVYDELVVAPAAAAAAARVGPPLPIGGGSGALLAGGSLAYGGARGGGSSSRLGDGHGAIARAAAASAAAAAAASSSTAGPGGSAGWVAPLAPKLIPRVLHQTYRSRYPPRAARAAMRSWAELNGAAGWAVRFYDDAAAAAFVRAEFPEYHEAYHALARDVERADFLRYMALLRHGGAAADVDAECRAPLDAVIAPSDTLLVGWDEEHAEPAAAAARALPRQRQLATWFFAAAPGHPALRELCDHVARHALARYSDNGVRDTQERTGQGLFTDVVLKHALAHPHAKADDPWRIRILPRVAFGAASADDAGSGAPAAAGAGAGAAAASAAVRLGADMPGVVVVHRPMASWQGHAGWSAAGGGHTALVRRRVLRALAPLLPAALRPVEVVAPPAPVERGNASQLFPVSASFSPPFTVMVHLAGAGDAQGGDDVSAALTAHGSWQPGVAPFRRPSVVEALVGALGKHSAAAAAASASKARSGGSSSSSSQVLAAALQPGAAAAAAAAAASAGAGVVDGSRGASGSKPGGSSSSSSGSTGDGAVLVDVGAGHGFFTLAAASRGHRAIAFETSPGSEAALRASVAYNGFGGRVRLQRAALGATPGRVCVRPAATAPASSPEAAARAAARAAAAAAADGGANSTEAAAAASAAAAAAAAATLRRARGYPHLADAAAAAADGGSSGSSDSDNGGCAEYVPRLTLTQVLANATLLGGSGGVAALRVSAHGHEGHIIEGALPALRAAAAADDGGGAMTAAAAAAVMARPGVIYVEFSPAAMRAAGYLTPRRLLDQLFALGYTDIAHAGRVCDARWANVTSAAVAAGRAGPSAAAAAHAAALLPRPTWCKLRPESFDVLVGAAGDDPSAAPENVVFVRGVPRDAGLSPAPGARRQPQQQPGAAAAAAAAAKPMEQQQQQQQPSQEVAAPAPRVGAGRTPAPAPAAAPAVVGSASRSGGIARALR